MTKIMNLDKLFVKIKRMEHIDVSDIAEDVGAKIKDVARENAPVKSTELRNSIQYRTHVTTNEWETEIYTPNEHALYVEVGTGPRGQENHEGISPNLNPIYSPTGWLIPIEKFPDYADYGYTPITIKGKQFIRSNGQKAQPFMYPALKDNEVKVKRFIKQRIKKKLKDISQ